MNDVVVYGATGFTGRLISAALARRGAKFAIAGRDSKRLEALAQSLPDSSSREVIVAGIDDRAGLLRMARRARVVLDCAGPFAKFGPPVLDAALEAGAHFLDITGEAAWMGETFRRDAEARARGVALINAVGFDVVPTDCVIALAAEAAGSPVSSVRMAFVWRGASTSQGTALSGLGIFRNGGLAWKDGALHREALGAESWEVPFPEPVGKKLCLSVPWGDVITAPRTSGAREFRAYTRLPRQAARFLPWIPSLLAIPSVNAIAEWRVRSSREGPPPEERAKSTFMALAEATGANGTRTAWVTGPDGYDFTAESASLCALLASKDSFTERGARTPAQAFGARALLRALDAAGVRSS